MGDGMEEEQARIKVTGKVQGVFYRAFVKQNAGKLGLKGYVKNMPGGSVEVVVQGPKPKIEQLSKLCKMGPMMARVESVSLSWEPKTEDFETFDLRF